MGQLCTYTKKSRWSGSRQSVDRAPPDGFAVQIGLLSQEKCHCVYSLQSEKMHFASRSAVHPFARIMFGLIPRSVDSNVGFYCFRRHRFTKEWLASGFLSSWMLRARYNRSTTSHEISYWWPSVDFLGNFIPSLYLYIKRISRRSFDFTRKDVLFDVILRWQDSKPRVTNPKNVGIIGKGRSLPVNWNRASLLINFKGRR